MTTTNAPHAQQTPITPGETDSAASSQTRGKEILEPVTATPIDGYLVPIDPMDELGCDSCQ